MMLSVTNRPRNVRSLQAAAILYGDWGTSKAYVIGLAFALSGTSAFLLILAVSLLMGVVGLNYIEICRLNPKGGGVYESARKKSEVLGLIGAYFLIADYLITASLSALAAFEYLEMGFPQYTAIIAITIIGFLNYFGPRNTGNLAIFAGLITLFSVVSLAFFALPHLGLAWERTTSLHQGFWLNWEYFVGMIVALSGVEAIANTTGVMQLDPGSHEQAPSVHTTAKKAIVWVMIEVCLFTSLFGLAVNALPNLSLADGNILAPNGTFVRDAMLRYMGEVFSGSLFGPLFGEWFGWMVSLSFGLLLLSAVNTAIHGLVSLLFVMSRDGETPALFQKLNRFGVPLFPLILAGLCPSVILCFVSDVRSLADLYAIGFVGAIATNLGVTALDTTSDLSKKSRGFMLASFAVMVAIEMTLMITKPHARGFAFFVVMAGLIARAFVIEQKQKAWASKKVRPKSLELEPEEEKAPLHYGAILSAVRGVGKTLHFALQEAKAFEQPLFLLFIREQKVLTEEDKHRSWLDDKEACAIFDYAKESSHEMRIKFLYAISNDPVSVITSLAKRLHVSRVILGKTRYNPIVQLLRGNITKEVADALPKEVDLVIIS